MRVSPGRHELEVEVKWTGSLLYPCLCTRHLTAEFDLGVNYVLRAKRVDYGALVTLEDFTYKAYAQGDCITTWPNTFGPFTWMCK